ncbi:fatty acid desaturase [Streptomyces sp. NPDC059176]|uniref:fatty acid desaturase n=1 Tax=unclassified Streptomyces TaxID=2593676 RepID=UPI0036B7989C
MSLTAVPMPDAPPGAPPGSRPDDPPGSDFAPLLREVRAQGLLHRRRAWYACAVTGNLLVLSAVVAALVHTGPSWWALLLVVPLSLSSARAAFLAHDAGHLQISPNRRVGRALQLVHGNLLLGMSQDWWNDKHNRHHAHPNHVDKDPDVAPELSQGRHTLRGDRAHRLVPQGTRPPTRRGWGTARQIG